MISVPIYLAFVFLKRLDNNVYNIYYRYKLYSCTKLAGDLVFFISMIFVLRIISLNDKEKLKIPLDISKN